MRTSYPNPFWILFTTVTSLAISVTGVPVNNIASEGGLVASTWYAGWHGKVFPPSAISWDKYTKVAYSFATITPDGDLSLEGSNPELLPIFVGHARKNGVIPTVSIGGWAGSRYYSVNVDTPQKRTKLVKTVLTFATQYSLGGLDFDWEYPGRQGIGCNTISPNDTANFLSFLQELRRSPLGKMLVLSAAVSTTPFASASGAPSTDVSAFNQVLDHIAIMNYDIWGPWSASVGPNAPLEDACAAPANRQGSAASAIAAWTTAGFPANKILLGVAAYGHAFTVRRKDAFVSGSADQLALYPPFDKARPAKGGTWDDPGGVDECGIIEPSGGSGDFTFYAMIRTGLLDFGGSPNEGVPYRYDRCSQTPYVYNTTSEEMISFDDARSFAAKGQFIKEKGLKGFAMWETAGDSRNILVDAIRNAAEY